MVGAMRRDGKQMISEFKVLGQDIEVDRFVKPNAIESILHEINGTDCSNFPSTMNTMSTDY